MNVVQEIERPLVRHEAGPAAVRHGDVWRKRLGCPQGIVVHDVQQHEARQQVQQHPAYGHSQRPGKEPPEAAGKSVA